MSPVPVNLWMLLDIAILVYWVGVAILIVSQDREPSTTLAWLLVLFAIPFLGLIIYFLFGRDWPHIVQRSATTKRSAGAAARVHAVGVRALRRAIPGVRRPRGRRRMRE